MKRFNYWIKNPKIVVAAILQRIPFKFIGDKTYIKLIYWLRMNSRLDLKNPKSFSEKIQWLKLYDRKDEYIKLVDKYEVKEYVSQRIGNEYIIRTLGVWESFKEISFDTLPDKFVLKTTHSGGSSGVVICQDKTTFDMKGAKKRLERSLRRNSYLYSREWPYKQVHRRIIAEEYIDGGPNGLTDYKFYCFNGAPLYCQVIRNRERGETIDFFDQDWKHQDFCGLNPNVNFSREEIKKPQDYDRMLDCARRLSKGIIFCRVDMYNENGSIYFGEITLYPAGGLGVFTPTRWNYILGDLIKL